MFNGFDLSTIQDAKFGNSRVSSIYYGANLIWPTTPPPPHDYSQDYLTFTALQDTTFTFSRNALQYSLDDGATWTTLAANTASPIINTGHNILWKQTGLTPGSYGNAGIGTFSSTGNFSVSGNIMSLYYGDNFAGQTNLTGKDYAFSFLFYECYDLIDAANLILPATTLSNYCYWVMFYDCQDLTTIPELPATTLARNCYEQMFYRCLSLTTPPELPATTLAYGCYEYMFQSCTALTTSPELPATTLIENCYLYMFQGCSSLNYIKCLATDISASDCIHNWVTGVASSGTFVKAASMTSWTTGNDGIPSGWTVINA